METASFPVRTVTGIDRVCRGCQSRHHERCNGFTALYETTSDNVLRLVACECSRHLVAAS